MESFFNANGWSIVYETTLGGREPTFFEFESIGLSNATQRFLAEQYPKGLFGQQYSAVKQFQNGVNVCLATGTASGKSLAFYIAGFEKLVKQPGSRILAIYPLKALASEQEKRWEKAMRSAGLPFRVGRIDGQVAVANRLAVLRSSSVLVATPDILHAWLLSSASEPAVQNFLKSLALVVVDEVHTYTGVFGSNSAYLFRRLLHLSKMLGAEPQFICASATIANPERHLMDLIGEDFELVGPEQDTSQQFPIQIRFIEPPGVSDLLSEVTSLINDMVLKTEHRFITFVDSRKQTEHMSSILSRCEDKPEEPENEFRDLDHLQRLDVLPYRAGYEEYDRTIIQKRLAIGTVRGVISTSALELGMDIPYLTAGVLVGVPKSLTSFMQRIGRIGRHQPGTVYVIKTPDLCDEAVFRNPAELMNRPLAEGALYLENRRVQYIHAMCLARPGGEHDQVVNRVVSGSPVDLDSYVNWPPGFLELCDKERLGQIPIDLQTMKSEAGDDPNHVFPLRDVESQFKVELKQGPEHRSLGSLSFGQLMREAYPGAIYYYTTIPYRVYNIKVSSKVVQVRKERRYTTKPSSLPTLVFPNLTGGNVFHSRRNGSLVQIECNLQIRESLAGFKERRGPNETSYPYPLDAGSYGLFFNQPRFTRNYFTTGVLLSHPALNDEGINGEALAHLIYESFLMMIPFERRDVNIALDRQRTTQGDLKEGDKFLAIYDQTYGSLHLSSKLLESDMLVRTLAHAVKIASYDDLYHLSEASRKALSSLLQDAQKPVEIVAIQDSLPLIDDERVIRVIMPGTKGLAAKVANREFIIEKIFFSPSLGCLAYRGTYGDEGQAGVKITLPVSDVLEIPGESKIGMYDLETGEIESLP
ncbi:MAG: DEAD/DEAH box helicase [Bacillota bacterium]